MTQQTQRPTISGSVKSLEASKYAWPLQKEVYTIGTQRKAERKPIVWSCLVFPKEVYWGCDIFPFYPEQFAALFSVRRLGMSRDPSVDTYATHYCRIAEAEGFPEYTCGYARATLGYVINGVKTGDWTNAPWEGGIPLPDVMITTSAACDLRLKWFEYMAQMLDVPLFTLDFPETAEDCITSAPGNRSLVYPHHQTLKRGETDILKYTPTEEDVNYMQSQLEDVISFIETYTDARFDEDRFNKSLEWSYKANELRQEILQFRKAVPAPMSCADGFASAYPGLSLPGTKWHYDFFLRMRDELRERVESGYAALPNEKFRLLWMGLPLWFNLGIFNYFEKWGGVFAYEPAYNPMPLPPRTPDKPVRELAKRIVQGGGGIGSNMSSLIHDVDEYQISGVVQSYLITCRPVVFPTTEVSNLLGEREIPVLTIESDLVDERVYAQSQVETRLDAFAEEVLTKVGIER